MPACRVGRALLPALSIALCSCGSPAPSQSPMATASLAAIPASTSADLREVAVAELDVGRADGDPIHVTPGTLREGDLVWVLRADDPDRASHLVAVIDEVLDEVTMPFGWVPVEVDGAPSLRTANVDCPQAPLTVESLAVLQPVGGLACFGSRPMSFVGFTPTGCGAGGSPRTGTPDWLNGTWSSIGIGNQEPAPPDFEVEAVIRARVAQDLALQPCGSAGWYGFVGHFDDPASATCRTETTVPDGARQISIEPLLSQLLCRAQLVLTDATPLATPP